MAAPEGAPRVEVELVVDVQDPFFDALETEDVEELRESVTELALSLADVGMRFYPVLSEHYEDDAARPPYLMVVRVEDLDVDVREETIKEKDQEPRVHHSAAGMVCTVVSSLEQRREGAPALIVGRSSISSRWRGSRDDDELGAVPTYTVAEDGGARHGVRVAREDVLSAVDKAMVRSMRELVEAVDREFSIPQPSPDQRPTR